MFLSRLCCLETFKLFQQAFSFNIFFLIFSIVQCLPIRIIFILDPFKSGSGYSRKCFPWPQIYRGFQAGSGWCASLLLTYRYQQQILLLFSPFTEYEFGVLAVNNVGRGPKSLPVLAATGETSKRPHFTYFYRLLTYMWVKSSVVNTEK